jgi:hypothetical protein
VLIEATVFRSKIRSVNASQTAPVPYENFYVRGKIPFWEAGP